MPFKPYTPYALTVVAANDGRFVDFAPYVPSINNHGIVAFQATMRDGHSGVFTCDGNATVDIAVTTDTHSPLRLFASHPDINEAGALSVYGILKSGDETVLVIHTDGSMTASTKTHDRLSGIGPLGPTMNEPGDVAVRATSMEGLACIRLRRGTAFQAIAEAGDQFQSFEGLPVVNNHGHVVFRADLPDGRQGLFVHRDDQTTAVALTGDGLDELARFPIINDHGLVAFCARQSSGLSGIFTADVTHGLQCLIDAQAGFESFRGVLINNSGPVAFYGTPIGGQLGIYTGPDSLQHRLLGLGDTLLGATVVDLALNPVSVNERGQLAIRVALSDQRQYILRADPAH